MAAPDGRIVRLLPLALTTVVEDAAPASRFQILQTAPDRLRLRLAARAPADRQAAWRALEKALRAFLDRQSLPNVRVSLDPGRPRTDRRSGKLREVIASRRDHA
jgi:hypothetical protein